MKEKNKEFSEEVLKYLNTKILPKYFELESCSLHFFPDYMNKSFEYIFKYNSKRKLSNFMKKPKNIKTLNKEIGKEIIDYSKSKNKDYFFLYVQLIFKE